MKLRWKVLAVVSIASAMFAVGGHFVQRLILLPGFEEAELNESTDDLARCVQAIQFDCDFISRNASDYARWDDTSRFVADRNEEYIATNLMAETFRNLRINMLLFVRKDGSLVWGEIRTDDAEVLVEAMDILEGLSHPDHELVAHKSTESRVSGFLMTRLGPMLVGSKPITNSKGEGPIKGAVIMGRLFDKAAADELAERTRVNLQFSPIDEIPERDRPALAHLPDVESTWMSAESSSMLYGYRLLPDIFGKPAVLIRADLPRAITKRGAQAAQLATSLSLIGGGALCVIMWIVLSILVLRPIDRLTSHAVRIGLEENLSERLNMKNHDEIGTLAGEFDRMVDRLAESRKQLAETARQTGQAEIAASVLHNVGNVLTSVNVSASLVREKLTKSELPTLGLAAKMLNEHEKDLGEFLTTDERGRLLPPYLSDLAACLSAEHDTMLSEMKGLSDGIEHIRRIIDTQQAYAHRYELLEVVDPSQVVEQALTLCAETISRHQIELVRHVRPLAPLPLDKHKVLQILVNLITNAKQSLKESGRPDPQIRIGLDCSEGPEGEIVRFTVTDNGKGISAADIPKLFNIGFSTRPDGHGIGLHSAANLAREMGGTLTVASDGPGKGAAFTFEIPMKQREVVTA